MKDFKKIPIILGGAIALVALVVWATHPIEKEITVATWVSGDSEAGMKRAAERRQWEFIQSEAKKEAKEKEENERVDRLAKAVAERLEKLLENDAGNEKPVIAMIPLTGNRTPDGKRQFYKGDKIRFEWDAIHQKYVIRIRTNVNGVDITEFEAYEPADPWYVIYKENLVAVSTTCMHHSSLDPFETIYQRQYYRVLMCEEANNNG